MRPGSRIRPTPAGPRVVARYAPVRPSPRRQSKRWVIFVGAGILLGVWGAMGWVTRAGSPPDQVQVTKHHRAQPQAPKQHQDEEPSASPTAHGHLVG